MTQSLRHGPLRRCGARGPQSSRRRKNEATMLKRQLSMRRSMRGVGSSLGLHLAVACGGSANSSPTPPEKTPAQEAQEKCVGLCEKYQACSGQAIDCSQRCPTASSGGAGGTSAISCDYAKYSTKADECLNSNCQDLLGCFVQLA